MLRFGTQFILDLLCYEKMPDEIDLIASELTDEQVAAFSAPPAGHKSPKKREQKKERVYEYKKVVDKWSKRPLANDELRSMAEQAKLDLAARFNEKALVRDLNDRYNATKDDFFREFKMGSVVRDFQLARNEAQFVKDANLDDLGGLFSDITENEEIEHLRVYREYKRKYDITCMDCRFDNEEYETVVRVNRLNFDRFQQARKFLLSCYICERTIDVFFYRDVEYRI